MAPNPITFTAVFEEELKDIRSRREANSGPALGTSQHGNVPTTDHGLTGLALSGGGVRAASVSLGVLQALNAKGVIKRLDYLSTVSGGGYIGTLMTISMSLNKRFPFGKEGTDSDETPETKHLRDNSRYLIQDGIPSIISALAVYLRGIVMNALILLPLMLGFSILLIYLNANKGWILEKLALLPYWQQVMDRVSLPATAYAGMVLLAIWVVYAVVVSVFRTRSRITRRRLSRCAAWVLSAFAIVAVVEVHLLLLGKIFDGGWLHSFERLQTLAPWLAPVVAAVLPFVKRLGATASKETGDTWSGLSQRVLSTAVLLFLAAIVPAGLWLGVMTLAHLGVGDPDLYVCRYAAIAVVLLLTWPCLSVNSNSLHQLYRDRLGAAFLVPKDGDNVETIDNFPLSEIDPISTPYHLINTALNVPGSKDANRRGRNADFFLFSRRFIGSELTDYVATKDAERVVDRLNIGTAMAISGAAAAPNMGMASIKPLSPTIALLNIRLGRWIKHPRAIAKRAAKLKAGRDMDWWFLRNPWPHYLLREAFFKSGKNTGREGKGFLFLTDGGHIENLGVYELLRRRCKLIIAVDAEADPNMDCGSLVQLERFARIDLDTLITINWQPISARTRAVGEEIKKKAVERAGGPHVALGVIDYPPPKGSAEGTPRERGVLMYIKASLSGDENDYILAYKSRYSSFPHENTADQLFSEEQLEAYRSLGEHITRHFLDLKDEPAMYLRHKGLLADVQKMLPEVGPQPVKPATTPAVQTGIAT